MPGPKTPAEALPWIQDAMSCGRYILDAHFQKRVQERRFSLHDAKKVVATATACIPYADGPVLAGGTTWRVVGTDLDGATAQLGVEAYKDHLGKWVIVVTIMDG
ncbi:MAG: hypothetical protein SFX73_34385 [Kofleriaceae bacterium]|nr:hypothetical protein [Kofleriaceae bacterium]